MDDTGFIFSKLRENLIVLFNTAYIDDSRLY